MTRRCSRRAAALGVTATLLVSADAQAQAQETLDPAPAAADSSSRAAADAQPVSADSSDHSADDRLDASALALLALAEEAMTTLEYDRCRQLSQSALERGGLEAEDVARATRMMAVASAQLGDEHAAQAAFIRLLALDPSSNIAVRIAPSRRAALLEARGYWAAHRGGFALEVQYARRDRKLQVRVRDALGWAKTLQLWYRFGAHSFVKLALPAREHITFEVDDVGPTDPLAVYAFAVDAHDNVLLELGSEREPHVFAISEEERSQLMRRDIRGGQSGSYARRLEELGVQVNVHGYLSLEAKPVNDTPTFDLHHATIMVRASLLERVSLEIALEWEHLAREPDDFYLPHAFMDIRANDLLILRAGFFEVPVGVVNEYLYPDFLRVTGSAPLFASSIVPALWSEVGVELRGRVALPLSASSHLTYAAVISNGLEQPDAMPNDGKIAEGGDLREMRFHARDTFNGNKALAGRIGLEIEDFDFGVSAYTGRYTIDGARQLSIGDVDASYRSNWLTVRAEAAIVQQQTTRDVLTKYGAYLLVALRPIGYLEPYAMVDVVKVVQREQRVLLGFAVYPFPRERATKNLRLKSEAGFDWPDGAERQFVWFFQLTTGF